VNKRPKRSNIAVFTLICVSFLTALPTRCAESAKGSVRELVITYEADGKEQLAKFRENSTITL